MRMAGILVDTSVCVCLTGFGKKNSLNKESFEIFESWQLNLRMLKTLKGHAK